MDLQTLNGLSKEGFADEAGSVVRNALWVGKAANPNARYRAKPDGPRAIAPSFHSDLEPVFLSFDQRLEDDSAAEIQTTIRELMQVMRGRYEGQKPTAPKLTKSTNDQQEKTYENDNWRPYRYYTGTLCGQRIR